MDNFRKFYAILKRKQRKQKMYTFPSYLKSDSGMSQDEVRCCIRSYRFKLDFSLFCDRTKTPGTVAINE